uniref:Uncharacterized protein n=1 Tax=Solanum lycopersicum TaxID=4081 RepID=A0A3Q7FQB2_SOLLC
MFVQRLIEGEGIWIRNIVMIVLPEVINSCRLMRLTELFKNLFGVSGNKGCNAKDAISSAGSILIGIVTLHGLGLSRLVKFLPIVTH